MFDTFSLSNNIKRGQPLLESSHLYDRDDKNKVIIDFFIYNKEWVATVTFYYLVFLEGWISYYRALRNKSCKHS